MEKVCLWVSDMQKPEAHITIALLVVREHVMFFNYCLLLEGTIEMMTQASQLHYRSFILHGKEKVCIFSIRHMR